MPIQIPSTISDMRVEIGFFDYFTTDFTRIHLSIMWSNIFDIHIFPLFGRSKQRENVSFSDSFFFDLRLNDFSYLFQSIFCWQIFKSSNYIVQIHFFVLKKKRTKTKVEFDETLKHSSELSWNIQNRKFGYEYASHVQF